MTLKKVNPSAITLLKAVRNGITDSQELMKIVNVKKWQFNNLVKELANQDYIEKIGSAITFKSNSKTILFRDISAKFDIEKLLHDSNEQVFINLTEPENIEGIQRSSKLSLRTIQRAVSELESIGAVRRYNEGKLSINRDDSEQLYLFAKYLKTESERRNVETYAEIIYQDAFRTLKKVPKGKRADGELTGFSLFLDYGIEYHTTHDYYVKQKAPLNLEDVLMHAIIAAKTNNDKNGIVIATLFYLKNRNKLDLLSIRNVARNFGIADIWIDVEGYIRNGELKHPNLFLPREEFEEKARLYNIPRDYYTLPTAYPDLFKDIGKHLEAKAEAYLFGGENMRLKGLKPATKDCDIVVADEDSFNGIVASLKKMGYDSISKHNLSKDDLRIDPSDVLTHPARSRMDIFKTRIARKLILSDRMRKRSRTETYGKLSLGIMENEDVFLLKSVTLREGDIQDMARIAQSQGFNWDMVFDELVKQEHDTKMNFSDIVVRSLDYLYDQTGIRPPFYKRLVSHMLTNEINEQIRDKEITLKQLVEELQGDDITEKMIRNRIDYLERMKFLRKVRKGEDVLLQPRKRNVLNVPTGVNLDIQDRLEKHIHLACARLALSESIKNEALEVAKKITTSGALQGRRPSVIVAGILYKLLQKHHVYRSPDDIAKVLDIATESIYSIRKPLSRWL